VNFCGFDIFFFLDRSDHHCPYLGNCIGLKNYKNFYYFLVSVVFLTGIGLTFSLLHILDCKLF